MRRLRQTRQQAGFSLTELLVALGIMGSLAAMAMIQLGASQPVIKGDGAMRAVVSQMRNARELAIAQRRNMRLSFTLPGSVMVVREEVPGPATAVMSSALLEGGVDFELISGVPDTPDGFGNGAPIDFGIVTNMKFTPDGTFVNQNGVATNGTVFLALSTVERSVHAVTIQGSTGRIRGYRWDGMSWKTV
jgi:prepilin-type N-terminal cleavage/methylation domain-containing protein